MSSGISSTSIAALQRGAVVAFDAARDAAGGRRVRHQHHVAAGQRDERGQGGALVAALVLVDLDDDFLAFAQEFLDAGLVVVDASLEVVAGDFLQRQEAVALAAVFDEGRFERRLEPGDAALVDVGLLLFLRRLLDVDVVKGLSVDDGDAQLFCLRRVDQHAFHVAFLTRSRTRNAGAFRLWITASCASSESASCRAGARARRGLSVPALRHHGRPRERLLLVGPVAGRRQLWRLPE